MQYDLNFPRSTSFEPTNGIIKAKPEDFYVEELMQPQLSNAGEHIWIWLEKIGQNTEYLAGELAKFAGVKKMDVGYSGLKDRWAVTRQWFSLYMAVKEEPDWSAFKHEGVTILSSSRHIKKLRRGEHFANKFKILVSGLSQDSELEHSLRELKLKGFPNYFGPQRFGFEGANLERGERYFDGRLKASRSQRSFYLSAARSFLFNTNLAEAVINHTWQDDKLGGPLYGDMHADVAPLSDSEQKIKERFPVFSMGIYNNRLKLDRRPYLVRPDGMSWHREGDMLMLEFVLPKGTYATSLLSEVFDYRVVQRQGVQ